MSDAEPTIPIQAGGSEQPATQALAAARPSRGRTVGAAICLILAMLLTTPAIIAYWGQRTLNDTERYLDTVAPLIDSPEVQDAIATTVTDAISKQVNTEAVINNVFSGVITDRPRLQLLVGPLAGAINSMIDQQVRDFIASDAFADLWVTANTRAQQTMIKVLKGEDTGAVSVQGDQVVLDVSDVIKEVQARLVARGLTIADRVPIPEVDRQIVLVEAPQLKQMRTIYAFSNPLARWLLPVVLLLYLGAFLLARRRPRMGVAIGISFVVNAVIMAFALSVGRQLFVNELSGTVFGQASTVFYNTMLTYLERAQDVLLWLGLILIVAGWFAGSNSTGTAARNTASGGLESVGAAVPEGPVSGFAGWVAGNARWLRYAIVALGIVVLAWGNQMTTTRVAWSLLLVVVLLVVVSGARGCRPQCTGRERP